MASQKRERPEEPAKEDEPFPRGGKSILTPLEQRKLKLRAKADFERESSLAGRPVKKKSRSSVGRSDEEVCSQTPSKNSKRTCTPGAFSDAFSTSCTGKLIQDQVCVWRFAQVCGPAKVLGALLPHNFPNRCPQEPSRTVRDIF
jgi:hypothetical protein